MAGIYIHIPFCKKRCIYCGFYSTIRTDLRQRYVNAVCREMELRSEETVSEESIETIYLGGGTPSLLSDGQLQQIFSHLARMYSLSSKIEVTLEVNPDDITAPYAAMLTRLPINRISMGAQTFNDERLRFLHRRHTATQVSQAVQMLRDAGIRNISIDLMYGFPDETIDDWQQDIDQALALDVEHISAYCLMIEEDTPLWRMGIGPIDEEVERQMYELLIDKLTEAGYEHYEISNFARSDYRSKHNSNYWNDVPYIGLGAAAHSYDGICRRWNVSDILQYTEAIEQGKLPYEQEILDDDTRYNDRITVALRTSNGLDLSTLSEKHRNHCLKEARKFLDHKLLQQENDRLILTRKGLFISDMVMSELMIV